MKAKSHWIKLCVLSGISVLLFFWYFVWGLEGSLWEPFVEYAQGKEIDLYHRIILFETRLPEALTAILAGAGLAVSGLLLQTLFRNPLAGPYVLGVTSGASLGVAIVVLGASSGFFLYESPLGNNITIFIAAACGAGVLMSFVMWLSYRVENVISLLIAGFMSGIVASSIVQLLKFFAEDTTVRGFAIWGMGSFTQVQGGALMIMTVVVIVGVIFSWVLASPLNVMLLGEQNARGLGVPIKWVRLSVVFITALLSGTVTAFCGPIAFLGLATPHLTTRFFKTSNHRILVPACAITGSLLALLALRFSNFPGGILLPISPMTSLLGAPVVIALVLRRTQFSK